MSDVAIFIVVLLIILFVKECKEDSINYPEDTLILGTIKRIRFRYSPYIDRIIVLIFFAGLLSSMTLFFPLSRFPMVDDLVTFILKITFLEKVGAKSNYPDVCRVYYLFTLPMTITWYQIYYRWAKLNENKMTTGLLFAKSVWKRGLLFLFALLFLPLLIGGWLGSAGQDTRLFSFGTSLSTLIFLGWLVPLSNAIALFLFIVGIKKSLTGKI